MIAYALLLALAQDRPNEAEMFGAPAADAGAPVVDAAADAGTNVDEQTLFGPAGKSRFDTEEEKTDPLKIGGTMYLRAQVYWATGQQRINAVTFTSPDLLD